MMNNYKLPWREIKIKNEITMDDVPEAFTPDKHEEWFTQCIHDIPQEKRENLINWYIWFNKWFTQFLPHLCHTCKYGENGECDIGSQDFAPICFSQSIYAPKNRVISCTFYSLENNTVSNE